MVARITKQDLVPFRIVDERKKFEERKQMALANCTRQECFDQGYLTVQDMDDEELVAGRCRDQNGVVPRNGKKTELIPKEHYDNMVAEHEARFKLKLRQRLDKCIDVMTDIMEDDTAEPRDRFEAAKYLFERTAGRTPETVTVTVKSAPWEELLDGLAGIAAITRAEHNANQRGIIDAEVIEETDGAEGPGMGQEATGDQTTMAPRAPGTPPGDSSGSASDEGDEDLVEDAGPNQPVSQHGEVADADMEGIRQDRHKVSDDGVQQYSAPTATGQEPNDTRPPAGDVQARSAEPTQRPAEYGVQGQTNQEQGLITDANPELNYGRRGDEARSYADQARAAQKLMAQRKEARERRNNAKKQRKIARAMGADAIKTEITGAQLGQDGTLRFDTL